MIILATPVESMGISTGTTSLIRIIGSAIGPAIAGMFMQSQQQLLKINGTMTTTIFQFFPTGQAYNSIFLIATILSVLSIALAMCTGTNRKRRYDIIQQV